MTLLIIIKINYVNLNIYIPIQFKFLKKIEEESIFLF